MIHIYYGDGKGKTTAAVGLAVRAAGSKMKVLFVQFLKTEFSGERNVLEKLDNVTLTNHRGGDTVNCYSDSPEMLLLYLRDLLVNGKKPRFYIE